MNSTKEPVAGHHVFGYGPRKVIVLHDWNGDHRNWLPVIRYLSPEKFTYAFMDIRGQGLSLGMPGEYSVTEIADDIFRLADYLQWPKFALVAHSFTTLAAQLATGADRQQRIQELILACGFPAQGVEFSDEEISFFRSSILNRSVSEQAMAGLTSGRYLPNWNTVKTQAYLETAALEPSTSYFESFVNRDYSHKVRGTETPILVLTAEYDYPLFRYANAKPLFDELEYKNIQFQDIKNAGHYPNEETPVYLASLIEGFLAE